MVERIFLILVFIVYTRQMDVYYEEVSKLGIVVDYSKCDTEFYDDTEEECNIDNFPSVNNSGAVVGRAAQCCGFHGYFVVGGCPGKDAAGQEFMVWNVRVCHMLDNQRHPMPSITCTGLGMLKTFEDPNEDNFVEDENEMAVFTVDGIEYSDFCVSYECGQDEEIWTLSTDYCEPVDIPGLYANLTKVFPLCCGKEGVLEISNLGVRTCISHLTMQLMEVEHSLFSCDWRTKEHFSIIKEDELEDHNDTLSCVSVIKHAGNVFAGGISCTPACGGQEPCYRFCNLKDFEFDFEGSRYNKTDRLFNLSSALGQSVTDDNIEYSISGHTGCMLEPQQVFPEHTCQHQVLFMENGDAVFPEMKNFTLHYNEFCIAPISLETGKGSYMVQGCLPDTNNQSMQLSFYPYLLLASVGCLTTTVLVYLLFPPLMNHYSKIMLNFSSSLLLAFLVLAATQKPELFGFSPSDYDTLSCRLLGHLNQFFFLAAFTWMTIMSSEIYCQLNKYTQDTTARRMVLQVCLGYGLPAIIVFITAVVELTAPRCASYKPRFGHR